ncbi:MAG: DUF4118 domain-containing protein [Clostridiales bacterium]|nr:DUF4118 domain-containing protein [Clostridiales bacterium]
MSQTAYQQDIDTDTPGEHILVCLSSAPSNARIIKTAAQLAHAFDAGFTALYVRTANADRMNDADKKRLHRHIALAEQLGAAISTVYGEDIPYQIAEYARLSGVTRIVIGRSNITRRHIWSKPPLTEKLIAILPDLDIYIIPDSSGENNYQAGRTPFTHPFLPSGKDLAVTALLLAASTGIGFLFDTLHFTEANIITIYILGVMLTALFAASYVCSIISSLASVLAFNYFFTEPKLTFHAYESGYPATFAIMLIASLIIGMLADRLKEHAEQSAQSAFRTKILFDTNQLLQKGNEDDDLISITVGQLVKLLDREVIVYPEGAGEGDKGYRSLPIRNQTTVFGTIGIFIGDTPLEPFENSIVLSILGECALAIENRRNAREKEQAAILARNEQLRADLLRTISHDLRTPLTSISGNAETLLTSSESLDDHTRTQILTDIYDDALWLISLVENLLSITRIEDGRMRLAMSAQLVDEVIAEALRHITRKAAEHQIVTNISDDLLLARMDSKLVIQVILNLIDNAVKYTPIGSTITISARKAGGDISVCVSDNGPGIPDQEKPHIFEMFYTGEKKAADSHRSLGLGLALCKSIINAHGGELTLTDHQPHGCTFTFTLPSSEVELNHE